MAAPIYLDYHATTPVDARVIEAMLPYFSDRFGNAASRSHSFGWQADEAVSLARKNISEVLGVDDRSLYFTSGATEGINLLLKGMAEAYGLHKRHIVTVATEHRAVLDTLQWLGTKGLEVTVLPVTHAGNIDIDQFASALQSNTLCAVVMWANNETGVIHDMASIGSVCNEKEIPLICDATQAVGKIEVKPAVAGVDMMAFAAHKFYGPKGVGAVYINPGLRMKPAPLFHGGGHERGMRSGTLNVPGIVGMGEALRLATEQMATDQKRIAALRDTIESTILNDIEGVSVNGNVDNRLHTVTNLQIAWADSQAVMSKFRARLAISAGSACSAADPTPSHVLLAMGLTPVQAKASLRISLGRPTTEDEISTAIGLIRQAVNEYRMQSPAWNMYKQGLITTESGWQ